MIIVLKNTFTNRNKKLFCKLQTIDAKLDNQDNYGGMNVKPFPRLVNGNHSAN